MDTLQWTEDEPLAGLVGYSNPIMALGFYRYKCPYDPIPDGGEECSQIDAELGICVDEVVCEAYYPNGSCYEGCKDIDGETKLCRDALDYDKCPAYDKYGVCIKTCVDYDEATNHCLDEKNALSTEVDRKEGEIQLSQTVFTLLIVLIIVLVLLIPVLIIVMYMFKKNKVSSMNKANLRRAATRDLLSADEKAENVNLFEGDEKKENAEDRRPSDKNHLGFDPSKDKPTEYRMSINSLKRSESRIKALTDETKVKDLLKGKTAAQRRQLLREIQNAREAKIAMEQMLEHEKVKNDAKWAIHNAEMRAEVLALYDDGQTDAVNKIAGIGQDTPNADGDASAPPAASSGEAPPALAPGEEAKEAPQEDQLEGGSEEARHVTLEMDVLHNSAKPCMPSNAAAQEDLV